MLFAQGRVLPVMEAGTGGAAKTIVIALHTELLLPQELPATTQIFPLTAAAPKLMLMEVDPCPLEIVAPEGTVHV